MSTAVNVPKWTASGDWFDVCNAIYHIPVYSGRLQAMVIVMVYIF